LVIPDTYAFFGILICGSVDLAEFRHLVAAILNGSQIDYERLANAHGAPFAAP
jgi:hypothetical protein